LKGIGRPDFGWITLITDQDNPSFIVVSYSLKIPWQGISLKYNATSWNTGSERVSFTPIVAIADSLSPRQLCRLVLIDHLC
jgi:hypothetical protein